MRGSPALGLLLVAVAAAACAPPVPQADTTQAATRFAASPARLPLTFDRPLGLGGAGAGAVAEPAPVPNREIEAPPDRTRDPLAPRLEPMVLRQDRPQGMTFGSEHLRDSAPDRSLESLIPGMGVSLEDVLPGARLRIPFE